MNEIIFGWDAEYGPDSKGVFLKIRVAKNRIGRGYVAVAKNVSGLAVVSDSAEEAQRLLVEFAKRKGT